MTRSELEELIHADDRVLLEQAVRDHLALRGDTQEGKAERTLLRFASVFVDGRVSGLCQEGALELFQGAIREAE